MRRTRTLAAAMVLAMGSATGVASAQGVMGDKTASEIIAAERANVEGLSAPAKVEMPSLMPGDEAPALKVATYVKGTPVSEFEKGTAYMVDFWATWCGPCIAAMPHMTDLQDKYEDDNFRLIGVSIWERQEDDELIDHVTSWVEKNDEEMGYTVAIDDDGQMAESWMVASGQRGIPTAMIVDREGRVAWIGYGNEAQLDTALEEVINGTWDIDAAREARKATMKEAATENNQRVWYGRFMELAEQGEQERAAALAAALHAEDVLTVPGALNGVAWRIVENEGWSTEAAGVARDLAQAAIERTGDDPAILDTLAWAYYRLGEYDKAIKTEQKALDQVSGPMKADFEKALETFKARGG